MILNKEVMQKREKIKTRISEINIELDSISLSSEENLDKRDSLTSEKTELEIELISLGPKFEQYNG